MRLSKKKIVVKNTKAFLQVKLMKEPKKDINEALTRLDIIIHNFRAKYASKSNYKAIALV